MSVMSHYNKLEKSQEKKKKKAVTYKSYKKLDCFKC